MKLIDINAVKFGSFAERYVALLQILATYTFIVVFVLIGLKIEINAILIGLVGLLPLVAVELLIQRWRRKNGFDEFKNIEDAVFYRRDKAKLKREMQIRNEILKELKNEKKEKINV